MTWPCWHSSVCFASTIKLHYEKKKTEMNSSSRSHCCFQPADSNALSTQASRSSFFICSRSDIEFFSGLSRNLSWTLNTSLRVAYQLCVYRDLFIVAGYSLLIKKSLSWCLHSLKSQCLYLYRSRNFRSSLFDLKADTFVIKKILHSRPSNSNN